MITIISEPTPINLIKEMATLQYADMVKAVVDVELKTMAVGGSLHADEEKLMLENGSMQSNLWGINIYFDVDIQDRVEFDSMINLRPGESNKTRGVDNLDKQKLVLEIVNHLIHE